MPDSVTRLSRICVALLLMFVAGCTHFTAVDRPLAQWTPETGGRVTKQAGGDRSPELLVFVSFSGGGTRAAAFAYGVLQELAATNLTTEAGTRRVIDEIDMISSVSGGSFTSAYYGLRGDGIFDEFESRFLRKNVEGAIFARALNPVNAIRLLSGTFGRSDLAAKYYEDHVFDAATFADFNRPGAPFVVINTTDLATGVRFPFTRWTFDSICADLDPYPVSKAVAASSAVPVLLSPIVLENFAGQCGFTPPGWIQEALQDKGLTHRKVEARGRLAYLDREKRPWLHLVDGGIADNLGLRAPYDLIGITGDPRRGFRLLGHPEVRQILILSVIAHAEPDAGWSLRPSSPSLAEVVDSMSSDQIKRTSVDTIEITGFAFDHWAREISTPDRPVTFDLVQVSFPELQDPDETHYLNNIATNFNLSDEEVDRLIAAGRKILRESETFQAFLARNQGGADDAQSRKRLIR